DFDTSLDLVRMCFAGSSNVTNRMADGAVPRARITHGRATEIDRSVCLGRARSVPRPSVLRLRRRGQAAEFEVNSRRVRASLRFAGRGPAPDLQTDPAPPAPPRPRASRAVVSALQCVPSTGSVVESRGTAGASTELRDPGSAVRRILGRGARRE